MKPITATTVLTLVVMGTFMAYRAWGMSACQQHCLDELNACTRNVNWNNGHMDENMKANGECNAKFHACSAACRNTH